MSTAVCGRMMYSLVQDVLQYCGTGATLSILTMLMMFSLYLVAHWPEIYCTSAYIVARDNQNKRHLDGRTQIRNTSACTPVPVCTGTAPPSGGIPSLTLRNQIKSGTFPCYLHPERKKDNEKSIRISTKNAKRRQTYLISRMSVISRKYYSKDRVFAWVLRSVFDNPSVEYTA